jgi:hypothetical protein
MMQARLMRYSALPGADSRSYQSVRLRPISRDYVRQFRDMKGTIPLDAIKASALTDYARIVDISSPRAMRGRAEHR